MSRIRGFEAKIQKEVLQTRRNGWNENHQKKNEEQSCCTKDDAESKQIFLAFDFLNYLYSQRYLRLRSRLLVALKCERIAEQQIAELLSKLPRLDRIFTVHRKIGEGTFSSVYLGSLRAHSPLPDSSKRWFAIKHLVPTAHPARIEHELRCLREIGCVLPIYFTKLPTLSLKLIMY